MSTTMVYRHPGPNIIDGEGFDYIAVDDEQVEEYIEAGWSKSTSDALANSGADVKSVLAPSVSSASASSGEDKGKIAKLTQELSSLTKQVAEESAANRDFLELVANSAEIKFKKNISDANLRAKLTEAITNGVEEGEADDVDEESAD